MKKVVLLFILFVFSLSQANAQSSILFLGLA